MNATNLVTEYDMSTIYLVDYTRQNKFIETFVYVHRDLNSFSIFKLYIKFAGDKLSAPKLNMKIAGSVFHKIHMAQLGHFSVYL